MHTTPTCPGTHRALGDQLRHALGPRPGTDPSTHADADADRVDRLDQALDALETLLDLGWITPGRLTDALTPDSTHAPAGPLADQLRSDQLHTDAVRSLAEDLAVVRLRATTAGERSRDTVARARDTIARSEALARTARTRLDQARRSQAQSRATVAALESEVGQLRAALESRPRIEHAVGMVMLALGCDADTAWQTLSRVSQHTNRKLRDVADALAQQVAEGHGMPEEVAAALRTVLAGETLRSRRENAGRPR